MGEWVIRGKRPPSGPPGAQVAQQGSLQFFNGVHLGRTAGTDVQGGVGIGMDQHSFMRSNKEERLTEMGDFVTMGRAD